MMHATSRIVVSRGNKRGLRCGNFQNPVATIKSPLRLFWASFRRDLESFQTTRIRVRIRIRRLSSSSSLSSSITSSNKSKETSTTLTEHPIKPQAPITIYTLEKDQSWSVSKTKVLDDQSTNDATKKKRTMATIPQSFFFENIVTHFLPANYPASVAPGYDRFASLCFGASVAGSAGMVLSTQTLLLAVGIVGQNVQTASIMAGALNWVLKDGIGQLGGVWFASSIMGRSGSSQFDANPKYWRMMAAICLDAATFLEITAPLVPPGAVLALASVANVGKNIGFLTASASRAALHQSLAISGNLGDVTAKTASQSMAASLVGTALGIGLSPLLEDVPHFLMGFVVLAFLHQGCNYLSLQAVPLAHFNRHRLHLVLQHAILAGNKDNAQKTAPPTIVLSPAQVASQETFLPLLTPDDSHAWLTLGSTIDKLGGPAAVQEGISLSKGYLLAKRDDRWHLVFSRDAEASDLIEGMYHAYWIHAKNDENGGPSKKDFDEFWKQLMDKGWQLETDLLRIEPSNAVRIDYAERSMK